MSKKSELERRQRRNRAASFFARLVSIPAWDGLSEGQQRVLEEEFVATWPRSTPLEPGELPMAHAEVTQRLTDIMEGKEVFPIFAGIGRWQLKGTKVEDVVAAEAAEAFGPDGLQWRTDLRGLILEDPFPFRRCWHCGAVFAFVRTQRYCTPTCAREAVEAARRGTRNEYMRKKMAERRAEERAQKQKPRRK